MEGPPPKIKPIGSFDSISSIDNSLLTNSEGILRNKLIFLSEL